MAGIGIDTAIEIESATESGIRTETGIAIAGTTRRIVALLRQTIAILQQDLIHQDTGMVMAQMTFLAARERETKTNLHRTATQSEGMVDGRKMTGTDVQQKKIPTTSHGIMTEEGNPGMHQILTVKRVETAVHLMHRLR